MACRLLIVITLGSLPLPVRAISAPLTHGATGRVGVAAGVDLAAAAGGAAGGAGVIPAGAAVRVEAGVPVGVGAWAGSGFRLGLDLVLGCLR